MESNASWLELNTTDPITAVQFYSTTLGWEFEVSQLPEGGDYWVAKHNNQPVGGIFSLTQDDEQKIPPHWMTYMQVDNIQKAQEAAQVSGGDVTRPTLRLKGIGKLSIITDTDGALVGLIEKEPH